jgi:hypothetical protein
LRKRWIALPLGLLCAVSCSGLNADRDSGKRTAGKPPIFERFVEPSDGIVRDAHTGLEWTSHDNARDVTWPQADRYCGNLTLGDRFDWRLPEIGELEGLYDERLEQPCGTRTCHLDPAVRLTNPYLWSATQRNSRRFYFDFRFGASLAPLSKPGLVRRALCVRRFGH